MTRAVVLDGITHGTSGYKRGCRCSICRKSKSLERARERERISERRRAAQIAAEPPKPPAETVPPTGPGSPGAAADTRLPGELEREVRAELDEAKGVHGIGALGQLALALAREIDERPGPIAGSAKALLVTLAEVRKLTKGTDDSLSAIASIFGKPSVPTAVRDSA